jgi:uncharacterized protein with von Willebrand factor type A (vWA) domain
MDDGIISTVIQHDQYDTAAYQQTLSMYPRLKTTVADHAERFPTATSLIEDVFYSLYRPAPSLLPIEDMPLSATVNRSIISEMMNTTEWESVRAAGTVGDQLYSAMATATVAKSILTSLDKKIIKRLQELCEAESEAARLFAEAETLEDLAAQTRGDRAQSLYEQAEKAREEAKQHQDDAENLDEQLDSSAEEIEDVTRRAARTALEDAEAEVEATESAIQSYGGQSKGGNGGGSGLTLKEKMQLANKVGKSEKLKQVAELTGRMTRIALATQKSKIKHPPDEVVGIEIGADLGRVLPVELGKLADPQLEVLFFKGYMEKRLQQLELIGSEKQGRGPIIAALDSSGSMGDLLGAKYSKEVWSKAVTLALLAIARLQKRDMVVIHFAHAGTMKVFEFSKGEGKPQQVIANTEFFFNGGTQYDTWMQKALQLVEGSKYDKADTIIISDGQVSISASLEQDWNRRRNARGMRCYSVLLGDTASSPTLARVSDAIATIDNLAADNDALKMMFEI